MKTNKNFTNFIIDGYLMSNNEVNVEYLAEQIISEAEAVETLYNECFNTRRKTRNVAITFMMSYFNKMLKNAGYTNYYADNKQVIAYDRAHNGGLERVLDVVEAYVVDERNA